MHNKMLLSHAMKVLAQFIDASSAPLSPCELTLHSLSATTLCTSNGGHLQSQTGRERVKQRYMNKAQKLNNLQITPVHDTLLYYYLSCQSHCLSHHNTKCTVLSVTSDINANQNEMNSNQTFSITCC